MGSFNNYFGSVPSSIPCSRLFDQIPRTHIVHDFRSGFLHLVINDSTNVNFSRNSFTFLGISISVRSLPGFLCDGVIYDRKIFCLYPISVTEFLNSCNFLNDNLCGSFFCKNVWSLILKNKFRFWNSSRVVKVRGVFFLFIARFIPITQEFMLIRWLLQP